MAKIYIGRSTKRLVLQHGHPAPMVPIDGGTVTLTIGVTATASPVLGTAIKSVRLVSDTDCLFDIDVAGAVDAANGSYLPAGVVEYHPAEPEGAVVQVIQKV